MNTTTLMMMRCLSSNRMSSGDRLRLGLGGSGRRQVDGIDGAGDDLGAGVGGGNAVGRNAAVLDQCAQARTRHADAGLGEPFVEARSRGFGGSRYGKGWRGAGRHAFVLWWCKLGIPDRRPLNGSVGRD